MSPLHDQPTGCPGMGRSLPIIPASIPEKKSNIVSGKFLLKKYQFR
jgi:hypothetical protein